MPSNRIVRSPFREALEIAWRSTFTEAEWEEYERAKIAEQAEQGAISWRVKRHLWRA